MYEPYPYKLSKIKLSLLAITFLLLLALFLGIQCQLLGLQLTSDQLLILIHLVYFLLAASIVLCFVTFRNQGTKEFFFTGMGLLSWLVFKLIFVFYFSGGEDPVLVRSYFLHFELAGGIVFASLLLLTAFKSGRIVTNQRWKKFIFLTVSLSLLGNVFLFFAVTNFFISHPIFSKYNLPSPGLLALINLLLMLVVVIRFAQNYFKSRHNIYFWYTMAALFLTVSPTWFLFSQFDKRQQNEIALLFQLGGLIFLVAVLFVKNTQYLEAVEELRGSLEQDFSKSKQDLVSLQSIVNGLAVGVCSIDKAGTIIFVNEKFLAMFGFADKQLEEKNVWLLFTEAGYEHFQTELEKVKVGAVVQFEVEMKHRNGRMIPVLVNAAPELKALRQYAGCRMTVLEIAEKKEKERQLKDYSQDLEQRIKAKTADLQHKTDELNQAKRYYETLISGMLDILLVVDRNGDCTFINQYGKNLLGYEEKQLTSKRLPDFFADMERLKKNYGDAMKVELRDYEAPVKTRSGKTILCNWNVRYLFDADGKNIGAMCVGRDVSEYKAMQKKLEQHSQELEKLVAQRTGELKTYVNQLSKILKVGEELALEIAPAKILSSICTAIKSLGWKSVIFSAREKDSNTFKIAAYAGLNQRQIRKFISEHEFLYKDVFKYAKDEYLVSKSYLVKQQAQSDDSKWQPDDMLMIPVKFKTKILGFITVFSPADKTYPDVEQIHILETFAHKAAIALENRRLFEEARERARELAQVNQIKTDFFTTMSHELRTPLNSVISLTEVLLKQVSGNLNAEQLRQLRIIRHNGGELLKLINNILDLSKIDSGKLELRNSYFSIRELIRENLEVIKPLCDKKKIKLETSIDSSVPKYIFSDADKINRVLTNSLSNAVKYTLKGKVKLITKFNKKSSQLQFTVSDTGMGMTKKEIDQVFQPFSRSSKVSSKKGEGTGLGLAITKKLIDLMDGNIEIESQPGKGTTFRFTIPVKDFSDQADKRIESKTFKPKKAAARKSKPTSKMSEQKKILLVDDNLDNQYAVNVILKEQGYRVMFADNGKTGITAAKKQNPDLILIDMMMPEMDGYQATRKIRKEKKLKDVPIIAMTAKTIQEDKSKAQKAGCNDYLSKPFNLDDLLEKVNQWLGENHE